MQLEAPASAAPSGLLCSWIEQQFAVDMTTEWLSLAQKAGIRQQPCSQLNMPLHQAV